jgi:hypothetical protein
VTREQEIREALEGWLVRAKAKMARTRIPVVSDMVILPYLRAYMRLSERAIHGERRSVICIATIDVNEPMQRQGIFTLFRKEVERIGQREGRIPFVESIVNLELHTHLMRLGYENPGHWDFANDLALITPQDAICDPSGDQRALTDVESNTRSA